MDDNLRKQYTADNAQAWNEVAPVHAAHNLQRLLSAVPAADFNTLSERLVQRLQHIGLSGKSVAQVCCNNGVDLLSVRKMGAGRCVGFDSAGYFIEQARQLLAVANVDNTTFITADAYEIEPQYQQFDLVLITVGVLSWMPDIDNFFAVVSSLIKPGGTLLVEDMHPVLFMYEPGQHNAPSQLAYSYFNNTPWTEAAGLDYYRGTDYGNRDNHSFQHTMAAILMAAINAHLNLRHIEELAEDISFFCADLQHIKENPPLGMLLMFEKVR